MKFYRFTSLVVGLVATIPTALCQTTTVAGSEVVSPVIGATNSSPVSQQANALPFVKSVAIGGVEQRQ